MCVLYTVLYYIVYNYMYGNIPSIHLPRSLSYNCVAFMFGLSSALHAFQTVGETYLPWLARLDYIGISCMIVGSFLPVLYYMFFCEQNTYLIHGGIISFFGVGSLGFIFMPNFHRYDALFVFLSALRLYLTSLLASRAARPLRRPLPPQRRPLS